jgi:hypothetical protein
MGSGYVYVELLTKDALPDWDECTGAWTTFLGWSEFSRTSRPS